MSEKIESKDFFESQEIFQALFERSPDAILLVDPYDPHIKWPILLCNEAAAHIHGYDNKEILLSQSLSLLWTGAQDFTFTIADDYRTGRATRDLIHRKRDGTFFQVNYLYTPIHLKNRDLLMIIARDTTDVKRLQDVYEEVRKTEERFHAIFDNSPDGIVIINPTRGLGEWLIEDCNKAFLEMNGYEKPEELIGQDIRKVSFEIAFKGETGDAYRREYYRRLKEGQPIWMEESHKRKDGSTFHIQVSSRLVTLNGQERVLGIDRDITEEKHLRRYLEDLQTDVGRTFHVFSSTLFQMQLALTPTIQALGFDPFKMGYSPTARETWQAVAGPWNSLVTSLSKLLTEMKTDTWKDMFSAMDWGELDNLLSLLSGVERIEKVEIRIPVLQRASRRIIDLTDKIQQQHRIRKDLIREVKHSAEQLERMACLVILKRVQDRIIETDYLVRDIRERVLTGNRTEEKAEICELWSLVVEAQKGLAEYAVYKGVTFKEDDRSNGARVKVVKRHIHRAINNLLDNAIKYSWWRELNVKPWIDIRCYTTKEDRVYVEIEDYGVPIPRSEIVQELIFQLGYRGRLSGTRGRPGTGIGLFDARAMARSYGGDVTLSSRPASQVASLDELRVPHLKTATLYLPIYKP